MAVGSPSQRYGPRSAPTGVWTQSNRRSAHKSCRGKALRSLALLRRRRENDVCLAVVYSSRSTFRNASLHELATVVLLCDERVVRATHQADVVERRLTPTSKRNDVVKLETSHVPDIACPRNSRSNNVLHLAHTLGAARRAGCAECSVSTPPARRARRVCAMSAAHRAACRAAGSSRAMRVDASGSSRTPRTVDLAVGPTSSAAASDSKRRCARGLRVCAKRCFLRSATKSASARSTMLGRSAFCVGVWSKSRASSSRSTRL